MIRGLVAENEKKDTTIKRLQHDVRFLSKNTRYIGYRQRAIETHFKKQPVHLGELWDAVYNLEVLMDKRKVRAKPKWAKFQPE